MASSRPSLWHFIYNLVTSLHERKSWLGPKTTHKRVFFFFTQYSITISWSALQRMILSFDVLLTYDNCHKHYSASTPLPPYTQNAVHFTTPCNHPLQQNYLHNSREKLSWTESKHNSCAFLVLLVRYGCMLMYRLAVTIVPVLLHQHIK